MRLQDVSNSIEIPQRVENCPIVQAILEFRIGSDLPNEAVFGMIFGTIRDEFTSPPARLPILEIPEGMRASSPNLNFLPHFALEAGNKLLQIGPKCLSFIHEAPYEGWDSFFAWVSQLVEKIASSHAVNEVTRVGARYINMVEDSVWDKLNLQLRYKGDEFEADQAVATVVLKTGAYTSVINIADHQDIQLRGQSVHGSILDIDTAFDGLSISLKEALLEAINVHQEEKKTFFSLINDTYKNELKPVYETTSAE